MEIAANAAIGKAIYNILHQRYQAAGLAIPYIDLSTPGTALQTGLRVLGHGNQSMDIRYADPQSAFCAHILLSMRWAAHVAPHNPEEMVRVVSRSDRMLQEMSLAPLSDREAASLTETLTTLAQRQQPVGELGALGETLYYGVQRLLSALPPRSQHRQRRNQFLATARDLCIQIDAAPDVSTHKHLGSILGEHLTREVRRTTSGGRQSASVTDRYWQLFKLVMEAPTITS